MNKEHEKKMMIDVDYFCNFVVKNLQITPKGKEYITIPEIVEVLQKECFKYGHSYIDLLDWFKVL